MTKRLILLCLLVLSVSVAAWSTNYVDWVDWDRIEHWAGDPAGEKKCALVIDFQDGQSDFALVWGYRWNGTRTGEDLVRAVASQSSILTAMIQYTGTMGSTLNGLGVSRGRGELDYLHYDFERAAIGGEVSFGFFEPNTSMGQETAPGYEAEQMCIDAVERAKTTGIIEHPLNAFLYGYPAYDYDYWKLDDGFESYEYRWRAGWYDGYWSYWIGPNDYDYMSYSGLGMSSSVLQDGGVQAWKYIVLNGSDIGSTGGELAEELDYQMLDWDEAMSPAAEVVQPVDQNNVDFWVGTGDKAATVVFQFNDGKGPENLVYGYRWSGGWDDALSEVIKNVGKADPRMTVTEQGSAFTITYDSDQDGVLGTRDHTATEGEWHCYVKRVVDADFVKIPSGRWLNPQAVLIFSRQSADEATVSLPYQLFRPALDSEQVITVPAVIDYALADEQLELPLFVQVPEGGKLNTSFNWTLDTELNSVISSKSVTNLMGKVTAYKNFKEAAGTVKIRGSYTAPGSTKASYVYSNEAAIAIHKPARPITEISYAAADVTSRLNHTVDNALTYLPADATYTKINYKSSNTRVATASTTGVKATKTPGTSTITATYDYDSSLTAAYNLTTELQNPVEDITFECVDADGVITLTPKQMEGLMPIFTPADPDISDLTMTLSGNGTEKSNYIATMYKVNLWDENNVRTTPYELSGHREGECTLTVKATDAEALEKTFTVRVVDRDRTESIDYTTGTIMLNEEWYGHTNGGLNWYSPEYDVVYQAYERENPGMSFGCTSQYGIIYDGKLIVSSKQAADGGDPLPGGGRLVVADAATLKRLGSIDDIKVDGETKSVDGRALCGAGPGRVYYGSSNGIYIIDTETLSILGKIAVMGESSTDLYSGQIGDMVLAGNHAFAIKQSTGVAVIDVDTDAVVKEIADTQVQGITQSADGRVWYATIVDGHSVFVALDIATLEESERVDVPANYGTVTCGWGAWRSTQFTGAHSVNSLFFSGGSSISNGGAGQYCRYDIDDKAFRPIATVNGLPAHTPGLSQGAYGTIRYDDRNGTIIAGTTESKASGHYRYNWTHFINAETGETVRAVELKPYYWFQALPIFPDVYDPEMEDIAPLTLDIMDQPTEIELKATDRDNHDANIRFSLAPAAANRAAAGAVADARIEGTKLVVMPLAVGKCELGINVESNGRTVRHAVSVTVSDGTTGITSAEAVADIRISDRRAVAIGCEGAQVQVVNMLGEVVDSFTPDADTYTSSRELAPGVYVVITDAGLSKKVIVK